MSDTFLVRFTAENQISAEMRVISEQLLALKGVAESTLGPLSGVNSRLNRLQNIDLNPVATSISAVNSALTKLNKFDGSKLSGLQTALMSLNSVNLTKLSNQMEKLAISTTTVAKNMIAIAGALGKIDASNVNISVNAPAVAASAFPSKPATFLQQASRAMPAINRTGGAFGRGIAPMFNLQGFGTGFSSGNSGVASQQTQNTAPLAVSAAEAAIQSAFKAKLSPAALKQYEADIQTLADKALREAGDAALKAANQLQVPLPQSAKNILPPSTRNRLPGAPKFTNVPASGVVTGNTNAQPALTTLTQANAKIVRVAQQQAQQIQARINQANFVNQQAAYTAANPVSGLQQAATQLSVFAMPLKSAVSKFTQSLATAQTNFAALPAVATQVKGGMQTFAKTLGNLQTGLTPAAGGNASGGIIQGIVGRFGIFGGRTPVTGGGIGGGAGAPPLPPTAGGIGAGGGAPPPPTAPGGIGGFASSAIAAYSPYMKLISIFNSVSFAVQTVMMAYQALTAAIDAANEQEKAEFTLMALVTTQYGDAANAVNQYKTVVGLAIDNQQKFGGTLKSNMEGLQEFQQIAIYSGVSVRKLNETAQLLALRDPVQGVRGAIVSMQELFSGNSMSLRRRFELPAKETNAMAKAVGNADLQLQMLDQLLAKNGVTADVLNARMDTVAHTYDKYSQSSEQASQATSRLIAQLGEPITNLMNQALLNSATGINPLARLHRYLYNVLYPDDKTKTSREQTEVQKELYDQAVRAGDITDEQRKKELELKDAIEANAEAVKSRTSAYANYYALLAANKISSKFATQMGVVNANDKISSQITTNEQTKQQMLLTAAVTAYNQGNTESAKILSSVMIIDVNSKENSIRLAQELIDSQKEYNFLTQETANNLFKINQVALDMKSEIKSQYDSAKATELKTLMDLSLYEAIKKIAVGTDTLTFASMKLAETYKISTLEALRYLNVLLNVAEITPDLKAAMDVITQSAGSISNYLTTHLVEQKSFRSEFLGTEQTAAQKWIENWDNAHEKKNSNAKNNNKQLLDIQEETNKKLLQYDKDMYAKRMKAQEDYYASALQLQQLQIYDMTLNNLDLLENKNAKLDEKGREQLAKDRQQLLARENIEAYHQLRLNDAIATANTYALAGNAAFAQKYLDLQEEKNQKIADAQWKLHDTQVRLEGDPAAQLAAQKVYDEAIGNLDTYYNTRIGLAQSASRQEQEADRANRKAIITDAIDAVMKLENVDETKRQNIIDNLKIAGESINDLSGKYVTGVDAMRGSLVLLAEAMRNVTASAQILTPDQLNMFNGLGSGIGQNAGAGSTITINDSNNNTTVQVGGITVTVTSQANPDEIAATVLKTLQSQIAQRQGG